MPIPKLSEDRRRQFTFHKADYEDFDAFLKRVESFEPEGDHTEWHFLDAEGHEPSVASDPEAIIQIVRSWQPPVCAACHRESTPDNPLFSVPAVVARNQRREILCSECAGCCPRCGKANADLIEVQDEDIENCYSVTVTACTECVRS